MVPTARELIAVLSHHPEVYAEVVRHGALLLIDPWAPTSYRSPQPGTLPDPVPGAEHRPVPDIGGVSGYGRHLSLQRRKPGSLAGEVQFDFRTRLWTVQVKDGPVAFADLGEALEEADRQLDAVGYLLADKPLFPT